MSAQVSHCSLGVTLIVMGCCFQSQATPRALTFEQAVEKGTGLKGCPKLDVGSLEAVYLSDSNGDPKGVRPSKPTYLVFQAKGADNMAVIGPLAVSPTDQQLLALCGQRTCVMPE